MGVFKKSKKGDKSGKKEKESESDVQETCLNMLTQSYGTKLIGFDEPTKHQSVDRVTGPIQLDWRQDKRVKSIKREFYIAMMNAADEKKKRNSVPVFWAAGKKGQSRGEEDDLGVPRRFACDIPKTLTIDENGGLPEELKKDWSHCYVKMGFASYKKDSSFLYLVVIPDAYKPFQHRFSEFIESHDTFYGLTAGSGEEAASQTVNLAFALPAAGTAVKAGMAALGVLNPGGVGLAAVAACAALNFVVVNGIKGSAGNYLRYVMTPPDHKKDATAKSFDLDEDYYSGTEGSEDSEEDNEERIEELEDQVERMDMALARLEQEMKENRFQKRGRYAKDRNSTRHRRSRRSRSRSPARNSSAENIWC